MEASVATNYKNKSPAEQNSVDIAWTMLMRDDYAALRNCIYTNEQELRRFRQLVVNAVLATDIADKVSFHDYSMNSLLLTQSN